MEKALGLKKFDVPLFLHFQGDLFRGDQLDNLTVLEKLMVGNVFKLSLDLSTIMRNFIV